MVDKSSYKIYKWFINGFINSYKWFMYKTISYIHMIGFINPYKHTWIVLSWEPDWRLMNWETSSFEIPLIAASTSSGSLDHLNPQYSPAATCVFFDVARTFSKSNCDNGLGIWQTKMIATHNINTCKFGECNSIEHFHMKFRGHGLHFLSSSRISLIGKYVAFLQSSKMSDPV